MVDPVQDVETVQDLQNVELLQDIEHLNVLAFLNACSSRFKVGLKDLSKSCLSNKLFNYILFSPNLYIYFFKLTKTQKMIISCFFCRSTF